MGIKVDSRIKTPDARIPLLQTEFEVKVMEHNSLVGYCYLTCCNYIYK